MATITFAGVSKVFADGTVAVRDLDLEVADGELLVLVGPSGCGKSTVLRILAGLETPSAGHVLLGGKDLGGLPPQRRDLAMVFQSYALYPHKTVQGNLDFPLRMMGLPRSERERRVHDTARMLGLGPLLGRRPKELSGGQRQRVAMGRALVRQPAAFLLDEPLSNLDAQLRVQMRAEIADLQRRLGTTTLYVTHDQVEAMTLGDRLAVLRGGVLQQVDRAEAIYDRPANLFVARFIGSPRMTLLAGRLEGSDGSQVLRIGDQKIELPSVVTDRHPGLAEHRGEVTVGIRPEAFFPAAEGGDELRLRGAVRAVEALGHETVIHLQLPLPEVRVDEERQIPEEAEGQSPRGAVVAARLPRGTEPGIGDPYQVSFDPEAVHLFDRHGRRIGGGRR